VRASLGVGEEVGEEVYVCGVWGQGGRHGDFRELMAGILLREGFVLMVGEAYGGVKEVFYIGKTFLWFVYVFEFGGRGKVTLVRRVPLNRRLGRCAAKSCSAVATQPHIKCETHLRSTWEVPKR
jgi:hypothetical protein